MPAGPVRPPSCTRHMHMSVHMSIHVSTHLLIAPTINMSTRMPIHIFIHMAAHVFHVDGDLCPLGATFGRRLRMPLEYTSTRDSAAPKSWIRTGCVLQWMLHGCCMDVAWMLQWMLHGCCNGCCMDVACYTQCCNVMLHSCCKYAAWMLHVSSCCIGPSPH